MTRSLQRGGTEWFELEARLRRAPRRNDLRFTRTKLIPIYKQKGLRREKKKGRRTKKVRDLGDFGDFGIARAQSINQCDNADSCSVVMTKQGKATQQWVVRQLDAHRGTFADMRSVPPQLLASCCAVLFDTPTSRGEGHSPGPVRYTIVRRRA